MSGICGIINLNGAPVDQKLLKDMNDFMSYRGPDVQNIRIDGHVGFGHTLLRTTFESEHEKQPCSLDGQVWITADARIDGQADLKRKLEDKGRHGLKDATDPELILHAYHAWGEDCLEHLLGDFSFAIWDGRCQRLFCARDHFGVKLFYYAHIGDSVVFSNTLNCVRRHPAVSAELNDRAIADFLLFDYNYDTATTTFTDIQRLPPAHSLTWSNGTLNVRRYWTLAIGEPIYYRHASDYIVRFRELLRSAVGDRLRTNRIGVSMSGGLDSPTIAATALALLKEKAQPFDLRAQAVVYDKLIPDKERHYAGLVAEKLGIPIHFLAADDYKLYERQPALRWPEPVHAPNLSMYDDELKQLAAHSRVVLTGWDGDAILNESPLPYLNVLLKKFKINKLIEGMAWLVMNRPNQMLKSVAVRLKRFLGQKSDNMKTPYPSWLSMIFEKRLDVPARWEQMNTMPKKNHLIRPYAHRVLTSTYLWLDIFEWYDAGINSFQLEFRHPFLDLRLMDFCLALPPVPWCVNKELLRAAMRDVLPESVYRRPKSPLAGDPVFELLRQSDSNLIDNLAHPAPDFVRYVDYDAIGSVIEKKDTNIAWMNIRPLSLNYWLQSLEQANHILQEV